VEVILAIGLVLAGLLIIDRLFTAEQRRRGRKDSDGSDALSAAIMDFDGFLNPGRRHQIDEKRRQEMMRDEVAPSDPRFTQVDLDRGTVVIRLPDDPNRPIAEGPPTATQPPTAAQPPTGTEPATGADPTDGVDPAADLPRTDGRPGEGSG
jgi:Family of unknown function (DUF6191)